MKGMTIKGLIVHARDEESNAEELTRPKGNAGYEMVHYDMVMFGESLPRFSYSRTMKFCANIFSVAYERAWEHHNELRREIDAACNY